MTLYCGYLLRIENKNVNLLREDMQKGFQNILDNQDFNFKKVEIKLERK